MADISIGSDALLTTTLNDNDRVTITRAATGQQVATMTVADFMAKCAQMMPVVKSDANGLMSVLFYDMIRRGAFDRSYLPTITGAQLDANPDAVPLGVYNFTPPDGCSLAGLNNGLLVIMGKSVNIIQIFFERSSGWGVYYRMSGDWVHWSIWTKVFQTSI